MAYLSLPLSCVFHLLTQLALTFDHRLISAAKIAPRRRPLRSNPNESKEHRRNKPT
jgi:hypothetical protein